jgi:DNA (cytosine-5)-methyltransferase 1
MIADDLFAGAGGWDLAAQALGIHARGIENMPAARATRDAAGLTTIHDDVWTYQPTEADGLIASPPCPTFSKAGKGTGAKALDKVLQLVPLVPFMSLHQLKRAASLMDGDERTALVLTPLWFATHHPYSWLAWEQVPTVLPAWEACADVLRPLGWNVWVGKLYSEQYGVPQTRTRAFLLASFGDTVTRPIDRPTPTHSRFHVRTPDRLDPGVEKWVAMAEALGWQPTSHQPDWLQTTNDRPNVARRRPDQPAPTIAFGHERPRWSFVHPAIEGETAEDCDWVHDRPSPTIVGTFAPDVVAKPGYRKAGDPPRQKTPGSVRVTVEEAGVLQSFPADFPWQGAKGKQFLQVGNAVPPLMALHALSVASGIAIPATVAEENVA